MSIQENDVQNFWQGNPCGEMLVGGLDEENHEKFFSEYDKFRYEEYPELLNCLDRMSFAGKSVLEIGLGEGADSEQIIKRGGLWSGVDLTAESVRRLNARLKLHDLPYGELKQGSALDLPFEENSFDKVYSCGVLHHVPNISQAQKEICRVLKPDGELIAMFYAKVSLNYLLSIFIFRRLSLLILYSIGFKGKSGSKLAQHIENAKREGIFDYLKIENFIHRNTDGPLNPYAKVYTVDEVKRDFSNFEIIKTYKNFMHAPPLPVHGLSGGGWFGWCLWVHMRPKK